MLGDLEPKVQPSGQILGLYLIPDELQVRNPWHIRALLAACARRGVEVTSGVEAQDFEVSGRQVTAVRTSAGTWTAQKVCITSGAWSRELGERIGLHLAVKPIRGQIVLLKTEQPLVSRVIYEGTRYLVPRNDGRILIGSTVEDVGFDRRTTSEVIEGLLDFAHDVVPALRMAEFERCWAGLRPGTLDGLPYLDRAPHLDNLFVAAGHFRSGLQLSPGTAVVMSQLMRGQTTQIDLAPLRIGRH
jgi:glycine oxidase